MKLARYKKNGLPRLSASQPRNDKSEAFKMEPEVLVHAFPDFATSGSNRSAQILSAVMPAKAGI